MTGVILQNTCCLVPSVRGMGNLSALPTEFWDVSAFIAFEKNLVKINIMTLKLNEFTSYYVFLCSLCYFSIFLPVFRDIALSRMTYI